MAGPLSYCRQPGVISERSTTANHQEIDRELHSALEVAERRAPASFTSQDWIRVESPLAKRSFASISVRADAALLLT